MAETGTPAAQVPLRRGDILELELLSWGRLGEAMARGPGGRDIFVFGGIPGERVRAEVVAIRRQYAAAQVVEALAASDDRVAPPCPYFGECTGCQWQHIRYEAQLTAKKGIVEDAMRRIGRFRQLPVGDVLPSPRQFYYRNHARFNVWRSSGALGFTHRERRRFVRIDRCMLMGEQVNRALAALQGKCGATSQLSIRASDATGDYLVQPALERPDIGLATGQKRYRETVAGREFWVASPSFFQVNTAQAARLAELVRDGLGLSGTETVVDAYGGVGTFAALLASDAARIIAIEESGAAVADARENAAGLDNVRFVTGKVEDILPELDEAPDAVILDPARAGCQAAVLEALLRLMPGRIAYVSCNPETLARDLATLCRAYRVESLQPVDMFPQTHHIECVAVLAPKPAGAGIVLASASPRRWELLSGLGLDFAVAPSNIPEEQAPGESPEQMVRRLAQEKALAAAALAGAQSGYYVGADSTVVLDGAAIAKPADAAEARAMLTRLRGTAHQVITGLTVYDAATGRCLTESLAADVTMRQFSDAEMERSIASGTPMDKAGAYAIQDAEFRPARLERGCYSNVMGLPLCRVTAMLADLGGPLPDWAGASVPAGCTEGCPLASDSRVAPSGVSPSGVAP